MQTAREFGNELTTRHFDYATRRRIFDTIRQQRFSTTRRTINKQPLALGIERGLSLRVMHAVD